MKINTFVIFAVLLLTASCACAQTGSSSEQERYKLAADYSAGTGGLSVLVYKGDNIVFEEYQNGHSAETPHLLASGTKSFNGILAIMAQEDGLLKLDERAADTITEWKTDDKKSKVTIRQLLSLTSGIPGGTIGRPPTYSAAIETPINYEPGTTFQYGPAPFQIFGEIMRRKLSIKNETVMGYMKRKILDPLGIKVSSWTMQDGNPNLPSGAYLTTREWLKFGIFLKNNGKWNGKSLVSESLLQECVTGSKANPNYGLTFWLNRSSNGEANVADAAGARGQILRKMLGADEMGMGTTLMSKRGLGANIPKDVFMAAGAANQRLYIIPSMDMVIVRQGRQAQYGDNKFLTLLLFGEK